MIGRSSSFRGHHATPAEYSGLCGRRDCRTSVVGRGEQSAILTGGVLVLGLRRHRRTMRFVSVLFLLGGWSRRYSAPPAVE